MAPPAASEKGGRYLAQLDAARCEGRWPEVTELARKVEKHAPSRRCLVATARIEAKLATQPVKRPGTTERPQTAKSEKKDNPSLPLIRELQSAIEFEKHNPEDKYQAQTCLAWLYWNNSDYVNGKDVVPIDAPQVNDGAKRLSDWTLVCIIKSAFFRASSEEGLQRVQTVPTVYEECLNTLESLPVPVSGIAEFCFWWERFFSRCCGCFYGLFQEKSKAKRRSIDTRTCLQAFRAWASNWDQISVTLTSDSATAIQKRNQRLLIWKSYYHVLSETLQHNYPYVQPVQVEILSKEHSEKAVDKHKSLFMELNKVESQYESLLLRQVSFPEASKINTEVDDWVNSLMGNWSILCGPDWPEDDLGPGGRSAASRRVLESLYKAATLTFHSTSVLRHLFTLHMTLAEFMLAEKALDAYVEIVSKGKARVEKSGVEEPDLDSDNIMLQTVSKGIEMLCEFGKRQHVEKSIVLANRLLSWLDQHESPHPEDSKASTPRSTMANNVTPPTYASVHKAIAISKASWARLNYESSDRTQLQSEAIKHLKAALRLDRTAEEDPAFLYPLALILAETRNIEGSVAVVKQALSAESRTFTEPIDQKSLVQDIKNRGTRNSPIMECWHLLSLLLSSRQEFETAEIAIKTALEQYEDPARSTSLPSNDQKLSFFQKKHVIEAKMTQIALTEVSQGSEHAVNATAELLALYTRFFDTKKPPTTAKTSKPPPTATDTIKSTRGSIFGRARKSLRNSMISLPHTNTAQEEPLPPTIAVTSEDSNTPHPVSSHVPARTPSHKLQKRRSSQSMRRSRTASPARTVEPVPSIAPSITSELPAPGADELRPGTAISDVYSDVGVAVSHDFHAVQTAQAIPLRQGQATKLETNAESRIPKSIDSVEPSRELLSESLGNRSFNAPQPVLQAGEEAKYGIAILNSIWLFVSSLYRRGDMLADAQQAMDEAFKQAKHAEAAVSSPGPSSVKIFERPGWGGVKSVEEVWADSYAEMGHLCVAEGDPYEAMIKYEGALSHDPDHAEATVALANILLDIHSKKIPLSRKEPSLAGNIKKAEFKDESSEPLFNQTISLRPTTNGLPNGIESAVVDEDEANDVEAFSAEGSDQNTTQELDLLAARDRAYSLLSNLTKLGSGWDDSNAWFALANAYEASGQIEKAKEVLWWVVELEEKRPIRSWRCLGQGYRLQK